MKFKRILTAFLSLAMILGSVSILDIGVSAAKEEPKEEEKELPQCWEDTLQIDPETGELTDKPLAEYDPITMGYDYAEDKLKIMTPVYEGDGYTLYYNYYSSEVACINNTTGQILWTNPYDVSGSLSTAAPTVKYDLLSQIVLEYQVNGTSTTMYSFNEAAQKGQINLKKIKNGIRVEYAIGEITTQRLVPMLIEANRYESMIASKIPREDQKAWERMGCAQIYDGSQNFGFYRYYNIADPSYSERKVLEIINQFPIAEKMSFYVCDPEGTKDLGYIEDYIFKYAPEYTYDELEYDHDLTGYVADDQNPPLFRLALEYIISKEGLEVRMPANGIRFDESTYQITSISVLPWMGAGRHNATTPQTLTGYTFIPDGSGALIRYEDVAEKRYSVAGQMYGADFAYHTINQQHAEIMRYPVFGNVQLDNDGNPINEGYVAIITEGDTMASLMSAHGGAEHMFDNVYASFNPRPYDSYDLADSMAVGSGATWTVTSSRKYTGNYRIKYVMLTNAEKAAECGLESYYEASYVGMAKAYRDYLEGVGTISRLSKDDLREDIPLYIESFGSIKTADRFLTVPVTVDTPLTTFEDVSAMYDDMAKNGITNINFRLRGFANGGMKSTVPYKLKWVEAVGGEEGFQQIVDYSKEKGFSIYPDFDFAYINSRQNFDGINMKKHAVRTIDNRYTSRRYYDAASQTFENDFALALSPSTYAYFYEALNANFAKYEPTGISMSTMGTDLNSDFDEEEPYNREDSKKFTMELLEAAGKDYSVMIDAGNAYTFKYADHILNMATESSKYMKASESVPFIGMVLHGYVQTAGTALNMEGDIETALLRAIENGSGLYFVMSYQEDNLEALKEDDAYSTYYSVGYQTWKEDAIEYYNTLNENLADLQTSLIVDHEFIDASRKPDADELEADKEIIKIENEKENAEKAEEERLEQIKQDREELREELGLPPVSDGKDTDKEASKDDQADKGEDTTVSGTASDEATEDAFDEDYYLDEAKYRTESGTVVRVEYEGGISFILNYNSFDVVAKYNGQNIEIGALDFVRVG